MKFIMNVAEEQALLLPGSVRGCKRMDVKRNILQSDMNLPQPDLLPPVSTPKGISRDWAEHIYKEICEFCRAGTEDLVAPEVK